ncbi:MAG TPA: apolipoprotein N-acyltransferase [Candidatus Hydrogenedentes bacterium]|nr:apolipoprotein N-acyltransferase [Candidatus Hydrogenedentota bacterium]
MTLSLRPYLASFICGVLLAFSFPSWHLYPLAWLALVPLFWKGWQLSSRATAFQFYAAGFVFHLVLLQWLMTNVYWAGGWAWCGYVALSAILAVYWFAVGWLWAYARERMRWFPPEISLPLIWGGMEYVQSFLFTGFGWGSLGYSQASDLWLAQWAAIGGTPLVSAFVVLVNVLLASAWHAKRYRMARAVSAVFALLVLHGLGALMMGTADYSKAPLKAALLQADFPLEMKWDREYTVEMVRNAAEKSRRLAAEENPDLIVWPESLIMDDIQLPGIIDEVSTLTRDTQASLLAGTHRTDSKTGQSRNAAYLVDADGVVQDYYDKIHLAPFGEYVPFSAYLPFITKVVPAIGDIEHGETVKIFQVNQRKIGPLICFEVLFPGMAETLRASGADTLVVMTNLGWFGASNAIPQELEIARMRAIEMRLPLLHCANTGITGVFDPWGRFTPVTTYFRDADAYFEVELQRNADMIMHRFGGVLPVAAPEARLWEMGPRVVPRLFLAASVLILLCAATLQALRNRKRVDEQ